MKEEHDYSDSVPFDANTFIIELEGEPLPVNYSDEALSQFTQQAAGMMDKEIRMISDKRYGPGFYLTRANRLGVIAPLIYNALADRDGDKILLCVLWLAANFPEISSIEVDGNTVQFVQDERLSLLDRMERPEYLN